jgi:hypothetical protein
VRASHTLLTVRTTFEAEHLIANAGLRLLTMMINVRVGNNCYDRTLASAV